MKVSTQNQQDLVAHSECSNRQEIRKRASLGGDECQVEAVLDKVIEKPFTMSFQQK